MPKKEIFKKGDKINEFILLEDAFTKNRNKFAKYLCPCGQASQSTIYNLKHSQSGCKKCRHRKEYIDLKSKNIKLTGNTKLQIRNNRKDILREFVCLKCKNYDYVATKYLKDSRRNFCVICRENKSKQVPYKSLFVDYQYSSKTRNIIWDLSYDQFVEIIKSNCFYCNYPPSQTKLNEGWKYKILYNGIDRKDNSKGYIKDNCVPCCKFCNMAKGKNSLKDFLKWLNYVKGTV